MRRPQKATWLAVLLGGAGFLHLARPRAYDWMVPPELGNARAWVLVSGVAEIGIAGLLTRPTTRRAGGRLAAGLFVGYLPAHLHSVRALRGHPVALAVAVARLPLQVPLVRAALEVANKR